MTAPTPRTDKYTHRLFEEGDSCPECRDGMLKFPKVVNCSCHLSAPCFACVHSKLTCNKCEWEWNAPERAIVPTDIPGILTVIYPNKRKIHVFPSGWKIMDWDYDARSGSTMVYRGKYEGEPNKSELMAFFGDGSFGHRGPEFYSGRFTYTLITD